jgi:membrane peptidoglycan carboxypeptidase
VSSYGAEVPDSWTLAVRKNVGRARELRVPVRAVFWLLVLSVATIIIVELCTSWFEARLFSAIDRHLAFSLEPGPSPLLAHSAIGPYDQRLGFEDLAGFTRHLENHQFEIAAQARTSTEARTLAHLGLFPIYHEKSQTGLKILDARGRALLEDRYPAAGYPDYHAIPPLVVNTLLFIENRRLRDDSFPDRNPAIEWKRTGRALVDLTLHSVDRRHSRVGGSTLATQLEKMRHSPGGRTASIRDKFRQMASASLRAYLDGADTRLAEEQIICDYINSIPLAAMSGRGEVVGLADGLRDWYGADLANVNRLLLTPEDRLNASQSAAQARAYREVLSLFLALRAPTWYLIKNPAALEAQTDRYLRLLADKGILSPRFRDAALGADIRPLPASAAGTDPHFVADKASNTIRMELLPLLGLDNTYALDRLDLSVSTTIDQQAQKSITRFLESLSRPSRITAAHLDQNQLLDSGSPGSVIYSFILYEHSGAANLLRVQTDNFNQPLDMNQGTKLQLGSTAKLRTLINYLEIVADLHRQYASLSVAELGRVHVTPGDNLTAWALDYLATASNRSLESMLEAALERRYSGAPGEAFFTGGGVQTFANFERSEDRGVFTVSQGFELSVNLVFIRLLRDIEGYYLYHGPGASTTVLTDPADPARRLYLARFADMEGRVFLERFYRKYEGQSPTQALTSLASGVHLTPLRAAVLYRSVRPQDGIEPFRAFLKAHLPAPALERVNMALIYSRYGPDRFDLRDRGYLAHVHPLELWLVAYLQQHPRATLEQIFAASADQRQQVYQWLFKLRDMRAQNTRIRTMLEIDAFQKICASWRRLGYPFQSLVPSLATAIGVSGDTPAALAKLTGIVLSNGVDYPTVSIDRLQFGQDTPFDTVLTRRLPPPQPVLNPLIARLVRQQMIGVVANGTGRRLEGGLKAPHGVLIPVGGKTGTGDNEFRVYAANGGLVGSRVVNRTAVFTFFIGDRFFGTILAFVPGQQAGHYDFTSALAVQVLKDLTPDLLPLVEGRPPKANPAAVATTPKPAKAPGIG